MKFLTDVQLSSYEDKVKIGCEKCGLYLDKENFNPQLEVDGAGNTKTLIIGDHTGKQDDDSGRVFTGDSYIEFKNILRNYGYDTNEDFWFINAVNCRKTNKEGATVVPNDKEVKCCRIYLDHIIEELKPRNIILLGELAIKSMFPFIKKASVDMFRGTSIPDQKLKLWIHSTISPRTIQEQEFNYNLKSVYKRDIDRILPSLYNSFVTYPEPKIEKIYQADEIVSKLEYILSLNKPIYIDYETTGLKPYSNGHKIVSMSICYTSKGFAETCAFPYQYRNLFTLSEQSRIKYSIKKLLASGIGIEAHNIKFEDSWSRSILKVKPKNWGFDTQIASHILDNRSGITGLKHQVYRQFGIYPYNEKVEPLLGSVEGSMFNRVDEIPLDELLQYNGLDSAYGAMLSSDQKQELDRQELWEPYNFFHKGTLLMSNIQEKGICADEDYFHEQDILLEKKIFDLKTGLLESDEAKLFQKKINKQIDIGSSNDLKVLFYKLLDNKKSFTKKGNLTVDKVNLEKIDSPFIKQLLYMRKLEKVKGTYFSQFLREIINGKINPFFDLTIPVSYRSSSQAPNFQNIPTRDDEIKKLIRSGVKASPGRQLLFFDGSGMEVRAAAIVTRDTNLIKYINDPTTDMHRDTSQNIWLIPQEEVTKDIRFYAKNSYVFATLYGSYWQDTGTTLWETCIQSLDLKTKSGIPLKQHMKDKGISTLHQFLEHCKTIDDIFWNERFKEYAQWKKNIVYEYQKNGFITNLLGFKFSGIMNKKQLSNFPVQSLAFHLLLWILLELDEIGKKRKWKSWLNGQIHDEGILDAVPEEIPEIVSVVKSLCTDLPKQFPFINVPISMEFAVTPLGKSWYDKGEFK